MDGNHIWREQLWGQTVTAYILEKSLSILSVLNALVRTEIHEEGRSQSTVYTRTGCTLTGRTLNLLFCSSPVIEMVNRLAKPRNYQGSAPSEPIVWADATVLHEKQIQKWGIWKLEVVLQFDHWLPNDGIIGGKHTQLTKGEDVQLSPNVYKQQTCNDNALNKLSKWCTMASDWYATTTISPTELRNS